MKRIYSAIGILFVVLLLLGVSNPGQQDYVAWRTDQIKKDQNKVVKAGAELLARPVIDTATETHDYFFFTIFQTSFPGKEDKVTLGILNIFIPI